MTRVDRLSREELPQYEDIFRTWEEGMGFVPSSFYSLALRPEIFEGLGGLLRAVWYTGSVDPELKPMVALMASTSGGCRYCQAHEAARSKQTGVPEEKIAEIWSFEESEKFSEAERAALRLARDAGTQPNLVTDAHFEELREHYTDPEIVELVAVISAFGFLNRWNDTMATDLEEVPWQLAERTLEHQGWEPGKHTG